MCVSVQNFVGIGQTITEIFQDGGHPPFLDLWGKFWDYPQREFDALYHCAKFGCNRISRFDNTKD